MSALVVRNLQGRTVDALTPKDEEGRCRVRNVSERSQATFDPGVSEWGYPPRFIWVSYTEYIGVRRRPGEVKHLSSQWKINRMRFP
jgi:hypothetical protein